MIASNVVYRSLSKFTTCNGVHLEAKVVKETTSEKKIVTQSKVSGSTDCPSLSFSATCLKKIIRFDGFLMIAYFGSIL